MTVSWTEREGLPNTNDHWLLFQQTIEFLSNINVDL